MGASYGRPAPDYARSDPTTVVVQLSSAQADIPFLQMVIAEEERTGIRMPLDSLIVLARLRKEHRLAVQTTAAAIQKNESVAHAVLERLVEAGLIERRARVAPRTYTLSAQVYQRLGQCADYIRQAGFGPIQQEQMVLQYARTQGRITRSEAAELCRLSLDQAKRLLLRMIAEGRLAQQGTGKATYYELAPEMRARPHFPKVTNGTHKSQMRQYSRPHAFAAHLRRKVQQAKLAQNPNPFGGTVVMPTMTFYQVGKRSLRLPFSHDSFEESSATRPLGRLSRSPFRSSPRLRHPQRLRTRPEANPQRHGGPHLGRGGRDEGELNCLRYVPIVNSRTLMYQRCAARLGCVPPCCPRSG